MARKNMAGQLNMFDLFRELEARSPQVGDLEMVSLMPIDEVLQTESEVVEEPEAVEEPEMVEEPEAVEELEIEEPTDLLETNHYIEPDKFECPIMHREYTTAQGKIEISYLKYNKVCIRQSGKKDVVKTFESSKEAVDFYVEQIQNNEEMYGEE